MLYHVAIDGVRVVPRIEAASLAEVANLIRGTGNHFRVWSDLDILLIDTQWGDAYNLVSEKGDVQKASNPAA